MVTLRIKIDLLKIKRYFKENWGAPFIILFQALILLSVRFLVQGDSALANTIVTYCYCSLVIGVVLQLISFLMDERRKQKENE